MRTTLLHVPVKPVKFRSLTVFDAVSVKMSDPAETLKVTVLVSPRAPGEIVRVPVDPE